MKILIVHNRYKQAGGEDAVVTAEVRLLRENGYEVELFEENNDDVNGLAKITAAVSATYSFSARARAASTIARFRPDVMHCHNLFPRLSSSVYDAASNAGVPVVQTLHNFRIRCANGLLLRDGNVCELCLDTPFPYPAAQFGCYKASRIGSAAVGASIAFNHLRRTYSTKVRMFIALTEFCRNKFLQCGVPAERLMVKPNFPNCDRGVGPARREHILFVGRISPEKGVSTLIEAWMQLCDPHLPLKIVGTGPEYERLRRQTEGCTSIEWLGAQSQAVVSALMQRAAAVVVPSVWLEAFGLVAVEAFAAGTPVIASDIGSLAEIVGVPRAGLLVKPGDASSLREALTQILADLDTASAMGVRGRMAYERHYTAAHNFALLRSIYEHVCQNQPGTHLAVQASGSGTGNPVQA